MTRSFVVICTAALTVALVLAGVTSVFSYFTAVAAEASKCAGRAWLDGYRTGITDLLAFPLFSVAVVVMVAAVGRSKRMKYSLTNYDYSVFEFASVRITLGMFVICSYLVVALLILGFVTAFSTARYNAIARYCSGETAVVPGSYFNRPV